jgi:hypothetical protein
LKSNVNRADVLLMILECQTTTLFLIGLGL